MLVSGRLTQNRSPLAACFWTQQIFSVSEMTKLTVNIRLSKCKTFACFCLHKFLVFLSRYFQWVNPWGLRKTAGCLSLILASCWMLHQGNLQSGWNVPFAELWRRQDQCEIDEDLISRVVETTGFFFKQVSCWRTHWQCVCLELVFKVTSTTLLPLFKKRQVSNRIKKTMSKGIFENQEMPLAWSTPKSSPKTPHREGRILFDSFCASQHMIAKHGQMVVSFCDTIFIKHPQSWLSGTKITPSNFEKEKPSHTFFQVAKKKGTRIAKGSTWANRHRHLKWLVETLVDSFRIFNRYQLVRGRVSHKYIIELQINRSSASRCFMISLLRLIGNAHYKRIPGRSTFNTEILFLFVSSNYQSNPKKTSALPPKIMEGKMDFANSRYLSIQPFSTSTTLGESVKPCCPGTGAFPYCAWVSVKHWN